MQVCVSDKDGKGECVVSVCVWGVGGVEGCLCVCVCDEDGEGECVVSARVCV